MSLIRAISAALASYSIDCDRRIANEGTMLRSTLRYVLRHVTCFAIMVFHTKLYASRSSSLFFISVFSFISYYHFSLVSRFMAVRRPVSETFWGLTLRYVTLLLP